jgi:hypothetical protein
MFALPGRVVWRVRRHLSVAHPAGPALVPATPKPVNEAVVEVFERRQIVGWVEVDAGAPPVQVGLYLNDTPVSWVAALDPTGRRSRREVRQFRFPLFNFWRFAKTTDRVSVRIGGRPVPIKGRGMYYHPRTDGSGDLDELLALLAGGYVFSDTGRIQLSKSFDDAWKQTVLGLYGELRRELHEFLGVEPFLAYGTLLGAIREDGFIGHDHDFDCAYLSAKTDPAEAARELRPVLCDPRLRQGDQRDPHRPVPPLLRGRRASVSVRAGRRGRREAGRLARPARNRFRRHAGVGPCERGSRRGGHLRAVLAHP